MKFFRHLFTVAILVSAFFTASCNLTSVKIAFIVKDPSDSWYGDEIENALIAAKRYKIKLFVYPDLENFTGTFTHDDAIAAIKEAKSHGVKGIIISPPDVNRGEELISLCRAEDLKLMTVDDRLKDKNSWSGFNENVPHLGIDGYAIGRLVGISLAEEILNRGWNVNDIGVLQLRNPTFADIMTRVDGACDMLKEVLAFDDRNFLVINSNTSTLDAFYQTVTNRFPAYLARYRYWILVSSNDDCVIGGVRALGDLGISRFNILGFGINGSPLAISEMKLTNSGFFGSIRLSSSAHGFESCRYMYNWVKNGVEPDKYIVTSGVPVKRTDYQN